MAKKTAKKTAKKAARKQGGKGKRYSDAMKQKVTAFVNQINTAKGRGGVAAAAREFGVSPISINNWLKTGAGGGKPRGRPPGSASRGREGVLGELTQLDREIGRKRRELESLEARFEKLKASL